MKLAWYLPTLPSPKWKVAKQLGVDYAVSALPSERYYMKPWDFKAMLYVKESLADAGLKLEVIEPAPPHYHIKLGLPGRDSEIEVFKQVLRNMAALDIPCLLYTSDAADDLLCVDLGGRRIVKKKKNAGAGATETR